MDADLMAVVGQSAHLLGMQKRGDGWIVEARRDRLTFQQPADAWDRLPRSVLALTDPHRTFIAVAQGDRLVIRVEADRDRAPRSIWPGFWPHAPPGAGAAHDAAPGGLGPLPWFSVRVFRGHEGFPSRFVAAIVPPNVPEGKVAHARNRPRAALGRGNVERIRPQPPDAGRRAGGGCRADCPPQPRAERL